MTPVRSKNFCTEDELIPQERVMGGSYFPRGSRFSSAWGETAVEPPLLQARRARQDRAKRHIRYLFIGNLLL
jgi:hypothetical protein